jgi:hypothetical protein
VSVLLIMKNALFSDEVVLEGVKESPCFIGPITEAPWGSNMCNSNTSGISLLPTDNKHYSIFYLKRC